MPDVGEEIQRRIALKERQTMLAIKKAVLRLMKQKLTYQYLGVRTGFLRNSVDTVMDVAKKEVYVTVGADYGRAYETGDWSNVKPGLISDKYRKIVKKARREADSFWYKKKKRPFMRDSIRDANISAIIKENMGTK